MAVQSCSLLSPERQENGGQECWRPANLPSAHQMAK